MPNEGRGKFYMSRVVPRHQCIMYFYVFVYICPGGGFGYQGIHGEPNDGGAARLMACMCGRAGGMNTEWLRLPRRVLSAVGGRGSASVSGAASASQWISGRQRRGGRVGDADRRGPVEMLKQRTPFRSVQWTWLLQKPQGSSEGGQPVFPPCVAVPEFERCSPAGRQLHQAPAPKPRRRRSGRRRCVAWSMCGAGSLHMQPPFPFPSIHG